MVNVKNYERDVIFKILSKENLTHRIQRILLKLKSEVVRYSCWSKNIAFLMLIIRTLTYHRNCIWDFEGIFARQVSQRCFDKAISLHSVFPKPVEAWQFNISRQYLSLYNATWGWTVTRNQREGESTSRNLEEGHVSQTSCHRVFSVARLFLFLPLLSVSFLSCANLRCLRRHACRRSRWVGLACQNLPDATVLPAPRCKSRTEESERGTGEPRKEEHRARTQQDGMVKRAEDGRCLVVCRIWVSDLGPRPAVGRRVCQGNLFSRPSPSLPLAPLSPSLPDALLSVCLSLRSSRWAGRRSLRAPFFALSRAENGSRTRIVPECDFHGIVRKCDGDVWCSKKFFARCMKKEGDAERKKGKALRSVRQTRSSGSWWSGWKCWANGNGSSLLDIDRTSEIAYDLTRGMCWNNIRE